MSTSSAVFGGLEHITPSSSEQLCYVHCNFCDTVLAVSVPCSSLFKIVTVRCGHCTNLLSVNMRALLLPGSNSLHLAQTFLAPTTHNSFLEEMSCPAPPPPPPPPPLLVDQITSNTKDSTLVTPVKRVDYHSIQSPVNRPPEKRQRVPSAYNRFIKDEIQRIKAGNPDITHREAFSAAAKNWAHFPHIQFGLMPDQSQKKKSVHQQGGDRDLMLKEGFYATAAASTAAANVGISPF